MTDKDGMSYARTSMKRTGMSLYIDMNWEDSQQSLELQGVMANSMPSVNPEMGSDVQSLGSGYSTQVTIHSSSGGDIKLMNI